MSPLQLMIKALEVLKNEGAWYDFKTHFWDKTELNSDIKLVKSSRQALSLLSSEFNKKLLSLCKHEKTRQYETFEVCETCDASRERETSDEGAFWYSSDWKAWHF